MDKLLIALSTLLVLISPIVYATSILKGKTRPHRTTRFVLMVITLLSAVSLLPSFPSAAFWLAAASAIQGLGLFILSMRRGIGGWARLDIICLGIAAIGIIVWQTTGNAALGLYASIIADFVGCVPTFVKVYKLPDTENWQFYAMDTLASFFSIVALASFTVYTLSYPLYLLLINGVTVLLILVRRQALNHHSKVMT